MIKKDFIEHVHVDNGGYTVGVRLMSDGTHHILIEDGYYGYSAHTIQFNEKVTPDNLRKIGMQFFRAADELEKDKI